LSNFQFSIEQSFVRIQSSPYFVLLIQLQDASIDFSRATNQITHPLCKEETVFSREGGVFDDSIFFNS
jgi:hypothetical protein